MTSMNEVTYDNRVAFRQAMATKRNAYLESWLIANEIDGDRAFWAARIERINDAELAIGRLLEGENY